MGRYSPACTRLLSQYKTMSKLVEEDVPSIERFMSQYRVSDILRCSHVGSHSRIIRWITLLPYTESRSGSQPRLNTRAKQVPRRGNGSLKPLKASSHSWMRSNYDYEPKISCTRFCKSWLQGTRGSREARTGRGGARWLVGMRRTSRPSRWSSEYTFRTSG
jgi:hypothetical protein